MLVDISDKVGTGEVATESLNGQCYPEGRKQPIFFWCWSEAAALPLSHFYSSQGSTHINHAIL